MVRPHEESPTGRPTTASSRARRRPLRVELTSIADEKRLDRLCELNVIEQVLNVSRTTIAQNAWGRQELSVHGLIYGLYDGLLRTRRRVKSRRFGQRLPRNWASRRQLAMPTRLEVAKTRSGR